MQLSLKRLAKIYGFADVGGNPGRPCGDCRIGMRKRIDDTCRENVGDKGGIWR
jgi:hypothetical protein